MFRQIKPFVTLNILLIVWTLSVWAADTDIRLNTVGFLPNEEKRASIAMECTEFQIIRVKDNVMVYQGNVADPILNPDTHETLRTADFSSFSEPGNYLMRVPGVGQTARFSIDTDVYNFPFHTVMKGMYLWRCGTAVSGTHGGITYAHEACHLDDGWLDYVGQKGKKKNGLKGWHDAGDYNKYVVNAGVTLGAMFQAWEQFPAIHSIKLDIPENTNDLPDFLDEIKWEMDWILTMQADDGSVYHKLSTEKFCAFILPEQEKTKRYFTPAGTAATADFVAMTAMATRIFQPYDPTYAQQCAEAAKKSYAFLLAHPEDLRADVRGFSTGEYGTHDPDDRLWAAAEMWQTFGDANFLKDFEDRAAQLDPLIDSNWDWGNVKNLGMFTYVLSKREGKNPEISARIRDAVTANADTLVKLSKNHGYARPLEWYYWGCNGTVARQCMNLMTANQLAPKPEYITTALAALDHLFGRNYYGRSFVTGLGFNPPMHPHDRRSGADNIMEPWPGYLVGGGHTATNWVDEERNYETNEIAINWNGALIYALAAFVAP